MALNRTMDDWFDEYGKYHVNGTNKVIHWICIPLITLSLLGLLWSIPMPARIRSVSPWLNLATLFTLVSLAFYVRLSTAIALGMAGIAAMMLVLIYLLDAQATGIVWKCSLLIFLVAWIGQFIGHKIEGKKPAFFEDLQFLLVGPAWLLGFIYKRFGIRY